MRIRKKVEGGKGGVLTRNCWEEIRERGRKGKGLKGYEGERSFFEEREWRM